ncbi:MAG: metallophosphoesterase [Lachnospiraceae bacterium]|nr:metallophosphoesterase [Lachnospiraceae bacterium]
MIFAMSDIHGNLMAFRKRAEQLEPYLKKGDKLLLLGDFIDRGTDSFGCLKLAKELQDNYGKDQVVVIKGNHEVWFLDFLVDLGNDWLEEDRRYGTSKTFLSKEKYDILLTISSREEKWDFIRNTIKSEHKEFLRWMEELPLYYETPTQIFVHAGVDEDIPVEEIDYCTVATPDYIFSGKYPPTTGKFPKDIIAGHVAASHVAHNPMYRGVYFDGYSHYYIDGSVNKTKVLVCLAYDEDEKKYYELMDDGSMKPISAKVRIEVREYERRKEFY